jgi:lactoylglutathione lyase
MNSLFKSSPARLFHVAFLILTLAIALPRTVKAQGSDNQATFNHMALCARNLKKTAAFYTDIIGLKTIKHPFNDTVHVWLKIGNGLALHIIKGDCAESVHNIGIHLCFSVPSLEAFTHFLDAKNVTYGNWGGEPKKVQLRADGVKQIYLQDPDGFWIEINDAK